jgi:PAS domain S-box-containing protein
MHQRPPDIRIWRKPRYVPLQYRFMAITSLLLALLLAAIILVVSRQQSSIISEQLELRGLAIAQSLAATSKTDLITYNYISLTQSANQAAQDPDLVYVIIHDKEGRVAAYSSRADLQGKYLEDAVSRNASRTPSPLVQKNFLNDHQTPILDIAVPVLVPGSDRTWGVIRTALSLLPMQQQIRRVQLTIAGIGLLALAAAVLGCTWLARRITRPIARLVDATIVAAQGNLDQEIQIITGDEVEVLADNFSIMIREILEQQQQLETQLQEITALQRYLDKLLTTMSDGLLSVDMEGRLVSVNPAAEQMLGIQAGFGEQSNHLVDMLRHVPQVHDYLDMALKDPLSASQQELHVTMDREHKVLIVASSVLVDSANEVQQLIVNLHDVTEMKRLEVLMCQTERLAALGTLAAGMAHEIRNPLSAIKAFVQLLPRKLDKPNFLEKFQRTVPRELERINRLIEDLLELARAPRYQFELRDVGAILMHTVELFEEQMLQSGIHCHLEISTALPLVWADADQLAKAFNNLVQNALQAMPQGGELMVRACPRDQDDAPRPREEADLRTKPKGWLSIEVADTGVGIMPEDLKNIFNPFFTTKDAGTGLGLAITHKVIAEHGGLIDVVSNIGSGTQFAVYLPVLEARQPRVEQPLMSV